MVIEIGAIYKHYKGTKYRVVGIGKHTETGEDLVVYSPIDNLDKFWIRPLSMWNDIVDKDKNIKRFERENYEQI